MAEMKSGEADSLSKEETNFFRLFLCHQIGIQSVRNLFDRNVPVLDIFLRKNKNALTSPGGNCRCTIEQQAKLFPGGQVVDSTDFDFSLLYRLIRNCVPIPPPTSGWGNEPLPRHLNETDDIERIRNFRNFLAHSSKFEICEKDFFTYWSDLSQAIARLSKGGLSKDVESLRTKTFDKCIKHEIDEIRIELNEMLEEIRKEVIELRQDVDDCRTDIAHNREHIHNVNTRERYVINNMPVRRTGNRRNLDHLSSGRFEITPLAYRMAIIFMADICGSWLRWSNSSSRSTTFTFREITQDDRRYFHIFSADFPNWYVTMGVFSWYVRCKKGDPKESPDCTWDIQRLDYDCNDDGCYTLCTRDGNYMSADCTQRMHGQRGDINEKRIFFIRQVN